MAIDGRSRLGEQLNVGEAMELDLQLLSEAAGLLIARRMEQSGVSREEAVIGILGFAARLMAEGVVSLDTNQIYDNHPEVKQVVEKAVGRPTAQGQKISTARALTSLIVKGAKEPAKQEPSKKSGAKDRGWIGPSISDLFGELFGQKEVN